MARVYFRLVEYRFIAYTKEKQLAGQISKHLCACRLERGAWWFDAA